MIAYETRTPVCNPRQNSVQDKKFSPRQNPIQDKIREFFFSDKKIFLEKNSWILSWTEFLARTEFYLGSPVLFFELSRTNRCLSSLSGIYIPQ